LVSKKDDIIDILKKTTTGWQIPPAKPIILKCDKDHTVPAYAKKGTPSILIKKGDTYGDELQNVEETLENREAIIRLAVIDKNDDNLYLLMQQMKEVYDRYNSAPWSTSSLGTSTTYELVEIISAVEDERLNWFVIDCEIRLLEELVSVVIA